MNTLPPKTRSIYEQAARAFAAVLAAYEVPVALIERGRAIAFFHRGLVSTASLGDYAAAPRIFRVEVNAKTHSIPQRAWVALGVAPRAVDGLRLEVTCLAEEADAAVRWLGDWALDPCAPCPLWLKFPIGSGVAVRGVIWTQRAHAAHFGTRAA